MAAHLKIALESVPATTACERPIIVLGMHRSGTSLIAELVDKCGTFGNDEFLPADSRNQQGYWEYAPLVQFNRRLLASVGSQSFVPPSDQDEETLRTRASETSWRSEAERLVSAMQTAESAWYWKDPRLAVTLPFWQQFWVNPVYVIAVREPLDTAVSLEKRDRLPLTGGYVLWQRYLTAALKHTNAESHRIFVQYERLLADPQTECERLRRFVEALCRLRDARTPEQSLHSMMAAVNPSLRSNASRTSFLSAPDVVEGQKNLYRYLESMAADQAARLEPQMFEIYPGWRDYLQALATVEELRHTVAQYQSGLLAKLQHRLASRPSLEPLPW